MTHSLTLRILTPEGPCFDGPVDAVFLPGSAGRFEILPAHAPILTSLDGGSILWRKGSEQQSLEIVSGSAIFENDILTVCAQPR